MAILINKQTRVLIQGITGSEGSRAAREMSSYGTRVLAGVTPGKGGQKVEALDENGKQIDIPVFNTVKEALTEFPEINASLIAVPAQFVKSAAQESIFVKIPLVDILTEHVTVEDCARIYAEAKRAGVTVIGPSSVGIISPGVAKIGAIGSGEIKNVFTKGNIGVISKSGGMTAEISSVLSRGGLGQSTVVGIGGDQIISSDFVDIMKLFKSDDETKAIVIFGEVGGSYEEQLADWIIKDDFKKPVVAVIAGRFSEELPKDTVLGHAGAIVSGGKGSYKSKIDALKKAGVYLPETLEEMPKILSKLKIK